MSSRSKGTSLSTKRWNEENCRSGFYDGLVILLHITTWLHIILEPTIGVTPEVAPHIFIIYRSWTTGLNDVFANYFQRCFYRLSLWESDLTAFRFENSLSVERLTCEDVCFLLVSFKRSFTT